MIWSDRTRLALSVGAATLVPVVALVWLGVRVLQQDRDIERQRRRERLEVAAGRVALEFERRLQEIEESLARGAGLRLLPAGFATGPDAAALVYQPVEPGEPTAAPPVLAAAELLEFQQRDLVAAAAAYRRLRDASDPSVRAAVLVALARVLRQQHDRDGALHTYEDLERMDAVAVGGQPAALVALQGRIKVLEEAGDSTRMSAAVRQLGAALNAGRWRIDRATFQLYREMLDRWHAAATPADAIVRTEAAIRVWQDWRLGNLPPRGRRLVRVHTGSALAVWTGDTDSPRVWLASTTALDGEWASLLRSAPLRVSASDTDGSPLFGGPPAAGSLSLMPADTRLPFVLAVSATADPDLTADPSRRTLVIAGLTGALLLIVAAAYTLYRTTARELMLARQQSDFVSAVSHEFRTPLTSMRHLTDLLARRGVTSEERRAHYYELLAHETERLYRMVEALLSFGRIEAGAYAFRLEPVEPGELVRALVEEFRREPLARDRELGCDVEERLPQIHADRETLVRALWNLVENAAKYSEPGTPIAVFARRHDGAVLIGVGDSGVGIAPGERERIFQKFVRGADAKRDGVRGVGIGLALVKRIVEAHGGSVRVESTPGQGSTFTLVLPCHAS